MNRSDTAGDQTGGAELRDTLLEPLIAATRQALTEMAGTDVVVRDVRRQTPEPAPGDLAVVLGRSSAGEGSLALSFPKGTAAALAGRILAGVAREVDEDLLRDCVGEIGNVVAGQAKALLAETPYRFTFFMPPLVLGAGESRSREIGACLVVGFGSDQGEFALLLSLNQPHAPPIA